MMDLEITSQVSLLSPKGLGKKLAVGTNSQSLYWDNNTTHAEMAAIAKLPQRELKKRPMALTLVSFRFTKKGELRNAMPCIHCIKRLKYYMKLLNYRITSVIYSDNDGNIIRDTLYEIERKAFISYGHRRKK